MRFPLDCDIERRFVRRLDDVKILTRERIDEARFALTLGRPMTIEFQGLIFNGYVLKIDIRDCNRIPEAEIILRLTGPPVQVVKPCYVSQWLDEKAINDDRQHAVSLMKDVIDRATRRFEHITRTELLRAANEIQIEAFRREWAFPKQRPLYPHFGMDLGVVHSVAGEEPVKKEQKPMKVRNKFYVAAPAVTTELEQGQDNVADKVAFADASAASRTHGKWTRKNLPDAIKHAEQILEANPTQDHVAIVRIVRVVRRKKQPLVVEIVK